MPKQTTPRYGATDGLGDGRRICEALGFDPTNHHNALKCPYCNPAPARSVWIIFDGWRNEGDVPLGYVDTEDEARAIQKKLGMAPDGTWGDIHELGRIDVASIDKLLSERAAHRAAWATLRARR